MMLWYLSTLNTENLDYNKSNNNATTRQKFIYTKHMSQFLVYSRIFFSKNEYFVFGCLE